HAGRRARRPRAQPRGPGRPQAGDPQRTRRQRFPRDDPRAAAAPENFPVPDALVSSRGASRLLRGPRRSRRRDADQPHVSPRAAALREGWAWAPRRWTQVTSDTGVGHPGAATREKGERYTAAVVERLSRFFIDLAAADPDDLYEASSPPRSPSPRVSPSPPDPLPPNRSG